VLLLAFFVDSIPDVDEGPEPAVQVLFMNHGVSRPVAPCILLYVYIMSKMYEM